MMPQSDIEQMKDILATGYHIRPASLGDVKGPVAVRYTQAIVFDEPDNRGGR